MRPGENGIFRNHKCIMPHQSAVSFGGANGKERRLMRASYCPGNVVFRKGG